MGAQAVAEAYDAETGRLVLRSPSPEAEGQPTLPVSATGSHMAFDASHVGMIWLYNTESWLIDQAIPYPDPSPPGPAGAPIFLALSPTDETMASGDRAGRVVLWVRSSPADSFTLDTRVDVGGAVRALAFSSDGRRLFVAYGLDQGDTRHPYQDFSLDRVTASGARAAPLARGLSVVDLGSGQVIQRVSQGRTVRALAVSGRRLASVGEEEIIRLWDVARAGLELELELPTRAHSATLAFSPSGRRLAAGEANSVVEVWDLRPESATSSADWPALEQSGLQQPTVLRAHSKQVDAVAFVDETTLWSAGFDGFVHIWDLDQAVPYQTIREFAVAAGYEGQPDTTTIAYNAQGELVFRDAHGRLRFWDIDVGASRDASPDPVELIHFAVSDDGASIAGITPEGRLRVLDAQGRPRFGEVPVIDPDSEASRRCQLDWSRIVCMTGLAVSPSGDTVAWTIKNRSSGEPEPGLYLRQMSSGREHFVPGPALSRARFSPDGDRLTVTDGDGVLVWDLTTEPPQIVGEGGGWGWLSRASFVGDGGVFAAGSPDNVIRLYHTQDGTLVDRLEGHLGDVTTTAVSPDGQTLVSGSLDRTVRLWDLETGQQLSALRGHTGKVQEVDFAPDGRSIASASTDGTIRIWLTASKDEGQNDLRDRLDRIDWRGEDSLRRAGETIERFPDDPLGFAARAAHLAQMLDHDEASHDRLVEQTIADYTRALELDSDNIEYLHGRAKVYTHEGRWDEVTADASRLIELSGAKEPEFLLMRAHSRARAGLLADGFADAARALSLRPRPYVARQIQRALGLGALVSTAQRDPTVYRVLHGLRAIGDLSAAQVEWRYTTTAPGTGWIDADGFDDSSWERGNAPFLDFDESALRAPGTHWSEEHDELWLRHTFDLPEVPDGNLRFLYRTFGDVTFYLNGARAGGGQRRGRNSYDVVTDGRADFVSSEARLRAGRNVLAVHARASQGRFVDVGLYRRLTVSQTEELLTDGP